MLMYCYFILTEYHYAYWYMHRASVSRLKKIVYQCLTVPVHRHRLRIWLSSLRLVLNLLRLIHIPFCSLIRLLVLDTAKSKPTTWIRFQNVDWWIRGVVRHAWSVASWSWDAHGSAVVESCKGGGKLGELKKIGTSSVVVFYHMILKYWELEIPIFWYHLTRFRI